MDELGEKVVQFLSVTGCSEEVAKRYLDACAGDLDMAIGMHLENEVGPPPAGASATTSQTDPLSPTSYKEVYVLQYYLELPVVKINGALHLQLDAGLFFYTSDRVTICVYPLCYTTIIVYGNRTVHNYDVTRERNARMEHIFIQVFSDSFAST